MSTDRLNQPIFCTRPAGFQLLQLIAFDFERAFAVFKKTSFYASRSIPALFASFAVCLISLNRQTLNAFLAETTITRNTDRKRPYGLRRITAGSDSRRQDES